MSDLIKTLNECDRLVRLFQGGSICAATLTEALANCGLWDIECEPGGRPATVRATWPGSRLEWNAQGMVRAI